MNVNTPGNKFHDISYGDSNYKDLVSDLVAKVNDKSHHLCLFLGMYLPNKKKALKEFQKKLHRDVRVIDTSEIVSKIESETVTNLENLFEDLNGKDSILYFKNGGKLSGVYTNFSHSRVKYATPQERYFLKKVDEFQGLVIVDIEEYSDADKTLRRAAQSIISFTLPKSKIRRFWWHLKNYSLHGYQLKTKRPDAYGETG